MVITWRSGATTRKEDQTKLADAPEIVAYRGFHLNLYRDGDGWWILICRTDRTVSEEIAPRPCVFPNRDAAVEDAELAIDNFFRSLTVSENWPS
jgi:hypothetical protein